MNNPIMRGHPHGQKTYHVWIQEKEAEDLKKFKKNMKNFFDPSFVVLKGTFEKKPEENDANDAPSPPPSPQTPPSFVERSMIMVNEKDIPEETFFNKWLKTLGIKWFFTPFS